MTTLNTLKVGDTPLLELEGILAKLECVNPCGSIKGRIARYILEESRKIGTLHPGQRIVEATSGNTGIAMAWCARELGHPIVGVGQRLRGDHPALEVFAVEPTESAVMSGGDAGSHGISGIGDGFVPALASDGAAGLHPAIDGVLRVSTAEATAAARGLARCEPGRCKSEHDLVVQPAG